MRTPKGISVSKTSNSEIILIKGLNPISVGFGIFFSLLGLGLIFIESLCIGFTVFGAIILFYQFSRKTIIQFNQTNLKYNNTIIPYSQIAAIGTSSKKRNTSINLGQGPIHSMATLQRQINIKLHNKKTITIGKELMKPHLKYIAKKILERKEKVANKA